MYVNRVRFLKNSNAIKIALPQDEFLNMDLVCDFINEFNINHVFSVAPESQWSVIYRTVDTEKVKFHRVLTGYIDDFMIEKVEKLSQTLPDKRPIDIGYRTHQIAFWLGRHGIQKESIRENRKQRRARTKESNRESKTDSDRELRRKSGKESTREST